MEDLSISLEQFEEACRNAKGSLGAKFQQTLFEQIWAANDYDIFRALMVKRNIELNLQAMNILTTSLGQMSPDDAEKTISFLIDDDSLLEQVMKLSMADARDEQEALDDNAKEDVLRIAMEEKGRLEAERIKEQSKLDQALKRVMASGGNDEDSNGIDYQSTSANVNNEDDDEDEGHSNGLAGMIKGQIVNRSGYKPLNMNDDGDYINRRSNEEGSAINEGDEDDGEDVKAVLLKSKGSSINPAEIKARQEYLRKRRDKIIETKRKERQRQVEQLEELEIKEKRPKSAKVIKSFLENDENGEGKSEDEGLSFRRSLAAKLKAEVIGKHR